MTGPGRLAVTVTTSSPPPREPCRCTAWTLDGHRRSPPTTAVASRAAMREQRNALRSGREADLPSARSYALPPPPGEVRRAPATRAEADFLRLRLSALGHREREQAGVLLVAGGASEEVRAHAGDGLVGCRTSRLELDIA